MARPSWWHRAKSSVRSVRLGVERLEDRTLLAAGDLDPTFGSGGRVVTDIPVEVRAEAYRVAVQSDGKLVTAGSTSSGCALARYNPDGTPDTGFGSGVQVVTRFAVANPAGEVGLALRGDGKVLVVGSLQQTSGSADIILLQYHPDGSLDTGFGRGGKVITDFGTHDGAAGVVVQGDGKVVVVGRGGYYAAWRFALARYDVNGNLDTTFGTGGKVTTDFGPGWSWATGVLLQSDGRIVVGGHVQVSGRTDFSLARYNSDGSLDPSFGTGGKVTSDFGSHDTIADLALQTDGKIVAVGTALEDTARFALARYNRDGSLDATFGFGGKVTTSFVTSAYARGVAIQDDGKIVAVGPINLGGVGGPNFGAARYNPDGGLDTGFGTGGRVTSDFGGSDTANGVTLVAGGKILVVGKIEPSGVEQSRFALARYNTNGSLDTGFGTGGLVTTAILAPVGGPGSGVALRADGKVIVAGGAFVLDLGYGFLVARYDGDGRLDPTFGTGGRVFTFAGPGHGATAIALQPDGKIVVAGSSGDGDFLSNFFLVRYAADGTPDHTFGRGGFVSTVFPSRGARVHGAEIQPDGKILAVGTAGGVYALARYHPDGSLDSSFGSGGTVTGPAQGGSLSLGVALQADGKAVVVGRESRPGGAADFAVLRFSTTGSLDATFGTGGKVTTDFGGASVAGDVAVQSDGRIVVVGRASDLNGGSSRFALARYRPDGSLDAVFGTGGKVTTGFGGELEGAAGVVVQPDGKIVVAGGTELSFAVARYLGASTPNERFVAQLYVDLLQRPADRGGMGFWVGVLDQGMSRADVAQRLTASLEYRTLTVHNVYRRLLGRDADAAGLNVWVTFLGQGGTAGQLEAAVFGSDEYFGRSGRTAAGFVAALYRDALGRPPEPAGAQHWLQVLAAGVPRATVAAAVVASPESDRREVQDLYRRFLRRDADPAGHDALTALLQRGVPNELVLAVIVASPEYFNRA